MSLASPRAFPAARAAPPPGPEFDAHLCPRAVAAVADPVLRNRLITRSYWELALRLAATLGPGSGLNWCAVASWASSRAGQTIRKEDCGPFVGGLLYLLTLGGLDRGRAARAAAEGNLRVYRDVAPPFARFIDWFGRERCPRRGRLRKFLRRLRPGRPTEWTAAGPGQGLLRRAFHNYHRARYLAGDGPAEAKARRELVFLANAQVALHEQTHLQGAIERALPRARWLRAAVTRFCLRLRFGREVVPLAKDVPGELAPSLARIDNRQARALLRRFGVGDTPAGSGSSDWADLGQRMRFILTLMRARHDAPAMFLLPEE
jgi:hypothetical protein